VGKKGWATEVRNSSAWSKKSSKKDLKISRGSPRESNADEGSCTKGGRTCRPTLIDTTGERNPGKTLVIRGSRRTQKRKEAEGGEGQGGSVKEGSGGLRKIQTSN